MSIENLFRAPKKTYDEEVDVFRYDTIVKGRRSLSICRSSHAWISFDVNKELNEVSNVHGVEVSTLMIFWRYNWI